MTTIGIRELRQHASRYLAQVEAGEEISITNRGKTVARLVPVSTETSGREALIRAGVLTPARSPGSLHMIAAEDLPVGDLTSELDRVRDER